MGFLDRPDVESGSILGRDMQKATPDQQERLSKAVEKFVAELENIFPGEEVVHLVYGLSPINVNKEHSN